MARGQRRNRVSKACRVCREQTFVKPICVDCQEEAIRVALTVGTEGHGKHLTRLYKYDLTEQEFNKLYRIQRGACSICMAVPENPLDLQVDHDHETGEVRGLLCGFCNRGIGMFYDRQYALARAIRYLDDPPANKL